VKSNKGSRTRNQQQVEINLAFSRAPRAYLARANLWRTDLKRLGHLLQRQIDLVKATKDQQKGAEGVVLNQDLPHLSIAIFGPSGSGKSSLLKTLTNEIQQQGSAVFGADFGEMDAVVSLPVMDPTTWRSQDQFLYAFLASALEQEREEQRKSTYGEAQGLSPTQLAFQEVNEYLRVLDEPEEGREYDPLGLSLQKLERHTSGLRLRRALGDFVDRLARAFGAKIILLPVDDLDMAPHHLVDSLSTYQSFLTHPKLVPVFTFTDRMSEELIEVAYRNNLKDGAYEPPQSNNSLPVSSKLAVQFLARCFPVRNRIRLGPAPARVQRAVLTSGSPPREEEGLEILELLITSSFLLFGHPDKDDTHQVKAALRPSTLRRQLQVVDAMDDSRIAALRTPQFGRMAGLGKKQLLDSATEGERKVFADEDGAETWRKGGPSFRLDGMWSIEPQGFMSAWGDKNLKTNWETGYWILAKRLREERINATWATIFNGATWSLLNVHRDILRELGIFLEDLYSWTPRELRSVVVERILAQDRATRRTVLDRWFNRADYRRSQVLSLLAANIFRPWMGGEEPYGDEERPLLERRKKEKESEKTGSGDLDQRWEDDGKESQRQIRRRLTFPSVEGLLWFLNVTMGFYLPQIKARDWAEVTSSNEPVRSQISGNGWDLHHASINAVRMADAKREIFAFGMLFLNPRGYHEALASVSDPEAPGGRKEEDQPGEAWQGHLLLRIWSCCGYSRGRFWATFSLWRGLAFIGKALEVGLRQRDLLNDLSRPRGAEGTDCEGEKPSNGLLVKELARLVRSHCLNGLVPGTMLSQGTNEEQLLHGYYRWEPQKECLNREIEVLAKNLATWLESNWRDVIYPLPAGKVVTGWGDCFMRRIHGDAVLGGLWPRLSSTYMEEQKRIEHWQNIAKTRSGCSPKSDPKVDPNKRKFLWTAAVAAGAWSDILLEYWRGCSPILKLLLSCPVFYKSQECFGHRITSATGDKSESATVFNQLCDPTTNPTDRADEKDQVGATESQHTLDAGSNADEEPQVDTTGSEGTPCTVASADKLQASQLARMGLLPRLRIRAKDWQELTQHEWKTETGKLTLPALVGPELAIERADPEQFATLPPKNLKVHVEKEVAVKMADRVEVVLPQQIEVKPVGEVIVKQVEPPKSQLGGTSSKAKAKGNPRKKSSS